MKERSYLFDTSKVWLITMVVMLHFLRVGGYFEPGSPDRILYVVCMSAVMEGFCFVSGFFSKKVDKCRAGAFKMFIVPYLLIMPLMYLDRLLVFGHAHLNYFVPTHALWYLLVLFAYRFFIKDLIKIPHILAISVAVYFAAFYAPFLGETLALGRIFSFLFFFMLGYYCQWEHIRKIHQLPKVLGALVLAACVAFSWWYGTQTTFEIGLLHLKKSCFSYSAGILELTLMRLVLGVLALAWIFAYLNLIPDKPIGPKKVTRTIGPDGEEIIKTRFLISEIGQNTMTVYLLHIFLRYVVKGYGPKVFAHFDMLGDLGYYLVIFAMVAICVYVFSRPPVARVYDKIIDFVYEYIFYRPYCKLRQRVKRDPQA